MDWVRQGEITWFALIPSAMGAASSSNQTDLEFLVFLAILLHKAPSAFALTSFMLTSSYFSRRFIRHRLMIFSATAPVTALVTSVLFKGVSLKAVSMMRWIGSLLLFSGGSFLYVAAVHVLPEVLQRSNGRMLERNAN